MNILQRLWQWLVNLIRRVLKLEPVGFKIKETNLDKETSMADGTVDLQILDDGKGVLFTLTPVNKAGNTEPLPAGSTVKATSSAPASLVVAANPGDTTGLVFLGTVPQPPVDATAIVVTFECDDSNGNALFSTDAAPIDVTADNTPVGFTITETAQ